MAYSIRYIIFKPGILCFKCRQNSTFQRQELFLTVLKAKIDLPNVRRCSTIEEKTFYVFMLGKSLQNSLWMQRRSQFGRSSARGVRTLRCRCVCFEPRNVEDFYVPCFEPRFFVTTKNLALNNLSCYSNLLDFFGSFSRTIEFQFSQNNNQIRIGYLYL